MFLTPVAWFGFIFEDLLYFLKSCDGNNWRKTACVAFSSSFNHSDVCFTGQHSLYCRNTKWFSIAIHNAPEVQTLTQALQRVFAGGVFGKRFGNNLRFDRIRLDIVRFEVVDVSERCLAWPLATPEFLANPTLDVL